MYLLCDLYVVNCTTVFNISQPVKSVLLGDNREVVGVETEDGIKVDAKTVLSNATAHVTFLKLLPEGSLPKDFEASIKGIDYTSPVCKLNGKTC